MKVALKNNKSSLMDILIDFFASLYDLAYDFIKLLVAFFAYQYDLIHDFISFLSEYLKWITDIHSTKSADFTTPAEEPIKTHNVNPFDAR